MVFVAITAMGGLVAFFLYHRVVVTKFERSLANFEAELDYFEAELDYIEDVLQLMRLQYTELEKMMTPRSQVKRAPKMKVGRPTNPNSARQKKLRGEK